jgi:rRNA maturation RNase YbeY
MAAPEAPIRFHFLVPCTLRRRRQLRSLLNRLFRLEGYRLGSLDYIFCSDPYLLDLNRSFLRHDFYTDILSFPLSSPGSRTISGEIYISVDRVRENARNLGESFERELHRVIFHGALHFCHYKDKTRKEQALMRAKEDQYLKAYWG